MKQQKDAKFNAGKLELLMIACAISIFILIYSISAFIFTLKINDLNNYEKDYDNTKNMVHRRCGRLGSSTLLEIGYVNLYYLIIQRRTLELQNKNLQQRKEYYDKIYTISSDTIRNKLSDDILLHSNLPYTDKMKDNFRNSITYVDSKNKEIQPIHYDNVTDLWFTGKTINNYYRQKSEDYKIKLKFRFSPKISFPALATAYSNDTNNLTDIVNYYIENPNYYVIDTSEGLKLFDDSNNSKTNIENTSSDLIRRYFEPDKDTIMNISIYSAMNKEGFDELKGSLDIPIDCALDCVRYRFRDIYTSNGSHIGNKYNITFGFPILSGNTKIKQIRGYNIEYTKSREHNGLAEAYDETYRDLETLVIPIYSDGYLIGFNGKVVDNWSLMECITLLYKDNSESNPIEIINVIDKNNFSVRNNYMQINVKGNTFQIIEQNNIDTKKTKAINAKDDIQYDIDDKTFEQNSSPYRYPDYFNSKAHDWYWRFEDRLRDRGGAYANQGGTYESQGGDYADTHSYDDLNRTIDGFNQ